VNKEKNYLAQRRKDAAKSLFKEKGVLLFLRVFASLRETLFAVAVGERS